MAASISRSLISLSPRSLLTLACHFRFNPHPNRTHFLTHRLLSSSSSVGAGGGGPSSNPFTNSPASFDWSSDEDEAQDPDAKTLSKPQQVDKSKLPPPYDPFSKKPAIEDPADPSNLQEVFHKMRSEGLTNNAIKMFDALSKDGRTHEAMELFAVIKDKGTIPDVVAHTAVIEAYSNAGGHSKEALRTFERMLASGVQPNVYTYTVLVKGLAKDGKVKEAGRFMVEMMGKGMAPNAETYVSVFEACVREGKVEEGRGLLEEMKSKGFVPDEKAVRGLLAKRGPMMRSIVGLLFGK